MFGKKKRNLIFRQEILNWSDNLSILKKEEWIVNNDCSDCNMKGIALYHTFVCTCTCTSKLTKSCKLGFHTRWNVELYIYAWLFRLSCCFASHLHIERERERDAFSGS